MRETAGAAAYLLVASGVIDILYSLVYLLWTFFAVAIPVLASLGSISDGSNSVSDGLIAAAVMVFVPVLQTIGFVATLAMGFVTVVGGLRLHRYRSKGIVILAILCSTGAPALALVLNAGSALNVGTCGAGCITGCLLGNIPTAFVLLFGAVASVMGAIAVNGAGERFGHE